VWSTELQYRLLKRIAAKEPGHLSGGAYRGRSKLRILLGSKLVDELTDKAVVDFGCGEGAEAIELASSGSAQVTGVDIQEHLLAIARESATHAGVADRCKFCEKADGLADAVISIDAFEHFAEPGKMLDEMYGMLKPGGFVAASFGPTWFHPYGGHLFSVFPWAHLIFSEAALIRWRADLRDDGAQRFSEVAGGLNKMTIRRFETIARASRFTVASIETVPIRKLASFHNRLTREFTTAIVRCKLIKPSCSIPGQVSGS
jgi:SAM-dependent methyltransferase